MKRKDTKLRRKVFIYTIKTLQQKKVKKINIIIAVVRIH